MKYIKTYETLNKREPQIGDYVIMDTNDDSLKNYINTHIGQIDYIDSEELSVSFPDVPQNIRQKLYDSSNVEVRTFVKRLIQYSSPDRNEVEQYILNKKFNL